MSTIDHLLTLARVYGAAQGIEPTTVSYRAFRDSKKLRALMGGATITISRAEAVLGWFSQNWPKGTPWPDVVPRPLAETRDAADASDQKIVATHGASA